MVVLIVPEYKDHGIIVSIKHCRTCKNNFDHFSAQKRDNTTIK